MNVKKDLIELQKALFDFSKRNPFVHTKTNKLWFISENQTNKNSERIYQKATYYWREYGLETTLEVATFIQWSPPNEEGNIGKSFYTSPLFYRPCKIKRIRKTETTYAIDLQTESYFVNPILRHYFKLFFNLDLPIQIEDLSKGCSEILEYFKPLNGELKKEENKIKVVNTFDEIDCWLLINKPAVGNFNYKKSALGADYDVIINAPNDQMTRLLSGENIQEKELIEPKFIDFLDQSQNEVVKTALSQNTVIQGPPGTGKSHTIVALIGAFLAENKRILFVSEKRSALAVVNDRLTAKGLNSLVAYFNTNKDQKKSFYNALQSSWEFLAINSFNNQPISTRTNTATLLDYFPTKLNSIRPKIDGELHQLITVLLKANKPISELSTHTRTPTYAKWKTVYSFLLSFESQIIDAFKINSVAKSDFIQLNSSVFSESEIVLTLEKRINSMFDTLQSINGLQKKFGLDESLDQFMKLALTASILNMVDNVQMDLLNTDSKKYKSFNNWAKKYQLLKTKVHQIELANKKWTIKPSISEITELLDLLSQADRASQTRSVLRILRRNPAKLKTAFKDFHTAITNHTKIKLLESVKLEWRLKDEFNEVIIKLRHNLNITDPDNEIELIYNLRNKLNSVSQNEYIRILEHEKSSELIHKLATIHPDILKFSAQNRFLFHETEIKSIHLFKNKLVDLKNKLPLINHWLPELKQFFKLPIEIRDFIKKNNQKISDLNAVVAYQNLLEETRFDPSFKNLSGWNLIHESTAQIKQNQHTYKTTTDQLINTARKEQALAEKLLATPAFKLKEPQKQNKKNYKNEKRIILHEMNKQKRHLSVKTFFESTKQHLLKIQPVWIMNPLTVSENLPCLKDLFDVVIFDESSQIPLEDAIPAIYRAKQMVVVGDSKQMPPSSFFSSKADTKTILDQAENVLKNKMLKWHYRSQHPALIQFSNLEFYNGELICLPPKSNEKPIEIEYNNGIYDSGTNKIEAEKIAEYCTKLVAISQKNILIIAFSQEQEKEIQRQLTKHELIDHTKITTRNLENAQGIESDIVLISVGYGKNNNGDFRLNFGPINQLNGANRLNVLLTRAIEKMVLFTSVKASDFGLSENRGVQVLKDFLNYAAHLSGQTPETNKMPLAHEIVQKILTEQQAQFNYYPAKNGIGLSSFISHKKNRILLVDPGIDTGEVNEIASVLTILQNKYTAVKIILSLDLWTNYERVKTELYDFFCEK